MIAEHHAKIERERQSPNARDYLIAYWQKRIRDVELQELAEKRFGYVMLSEAHRNGRSEASAFSMD